MRDWAADAALAASTAIAAVDERGVVTWTNAAWLRSTSPLATGVFADTVVGTDLFAHLGTAQRGGAIASRLREVLAGRLGSFEEDLSAGRGSRAEVLHVAALGDRRRGAVLLRTPGGPSAEVDHPAPGGLAGGERLTPREHDVLRLMARGLDNRAIGTELGISYTTVRTHVRSIIDKFGARSRLDAVVRANRDGVVSDG